MPSPLCVIGTFAASGFFLHDLPFGWWIRAMRMQSVPLPFVSLWFAQMGLLVVLTDVLGLGWGDQSFVIRVVLNVGCILLPFLFGLYLLAFI